MSAATLVAKLAEAGTPPDLLAAVAEQLFKSEHAATELAAKRKADALKTRRYRKRGGGQVSESVRAKVFERDNFSCADCGSCDNLQIDHIIPVSKGGGSDESNLQTLCRPCNARKKDRIRKRDVRAMSGDVHGQDADSKDVTSKEKTPTPPKETISPKENPPKGGQKKGSADRVGELWNEIVASRGLPAVRLPLTGKRKAHAAARMREHSEEEVRAALSEVLRSEHWMQNRWNDMFGTFVRSEKFVSFVEQSESRKPQAVKLSSEELEERAQFYERINRPDDAAECRRKAEQLKDAA